MHGVSGSGKTTISQELLETFGAVRLRSDIERKRARGFDPLARTGSALEAGIYTTEATERTYEQLAALARDVLGDGFPVVVDATFLKRSQRRRFEAIASAAGARFAIVHCVAPPGTLTRRLTERARAHDDASEAGIEVLDRQRETQQPLEDDEWMVSIACDTSIEGSERTLCAALERRFGEEGTAPCATSMSSTATPTESARFIS
jgi:predicted kinase